MAPASFFKRPLKNVKKVKNDEKATSYINEIFRPKIPRNRRRFLTRFPGFAKNSVFDVFVILAETEKGRFRSSRISKFLVDFAREADFRPISVIFLAPGTDFPADSPLFGPLLQPVTTCHRI